MTFKYRGGGMSKDRDDLYAQNLAAGMEQLEAYHAAGFKGDRSNACRKANTAEMRIRVDKIHDLYLKKIIVDQVWVKREQVKSYFRAYDDRDHHACHKLLAAIGVDLGMGVQRAEVLIKSQYERKTDLELLQELTQVLEQASQQLTIEHQSEPEDHETSGD